MQILLAILSVLTLSQCGKQNTKSGKVDIKITPEIPIVITGDVGGLHPKTQPWFDFSVELTNNSDYTFKIVAVKAEIVLLDGSGSSMEATWAPSEYDFSNDVYTCSYVDFGTWRAGESKTMYLTNQTGASQCPTTNATTTVNALFTADNLPKAANPNNFRYRVKLKPLGYFINDAGDPDDRFERYKSFFTK